MTPTITTSRPLVRRPIDYLLLPAFVLGIINAVALSLPEGLGVAIAPDSPWPVLRWLHTWAVEQEPQHLVMPPALQASLLYDTFVQLPLLVVLTIGIWKLKSWPWLETVALVYAVSAVMNMYFYFMQTFLGPDSPPHLWIYLPMNLPWAIVPILVAYRFWPYAASSQARRTPR
jgi:EXPERA (EXPanded EBP superfamily)